MDDLFQIKKAAESEVGTIVQLAKEIWPPTYNDILSSAQIRYMMDLFYTPESLMEQIKVKQHRFLIGNLHGQPVAFASYSAVDEPSVFKLHKIYVHQDFQGRQLGKKMIAFIIDNIRKSGGSILELNVNRNNKARWFYEKLGFQVVREEDIDIGNGYFMSDYVMQMHI